MHFLLQIISLYCWDLPNKQSWNPFNSIDIEGQSLIKVDARDLWVTPRSMQDLTLQPPVTPSVYRSATKQEQQEEIQRADQKDPNSQQEGSSVFCLQVYQGLPLEAYPGSVVLGGSSWGLGWGGVHLQFWKTKFLPNHAVSSGISRLQARSVQPPVPCAPPPVFGFLSLAGHRETKLRQP